MDISEILDLIIIGSGPAGLTSSIYASCFHLKHTVIGEQLGVLNLRLLRINSLNKRVSHG